VSSGECGRKILWPTFMYYHGFFLQELRKNTKIRRIVSTVRTGEARIGISERKPYLLISSVDQDEYRDSTLTGHTTYCHDFSYRHVVSPATRENTE
jgi:hypothetical protein